MSTVKDTCKHCCIRIENLSVSLGKEDILKNVNIHVNCSELIAVVGPNGAGKTTLLKAIIGEVPYAGRASFLLQGKPAKGIHIGYVPQKLIFDPGMPASVLDLVMAGVSRRPVWLGGTRALYKKALHILKSAKAEHLAKHKIGELSGGELQRVLLSLAMEPAPNLLLLDEPASNIDIKGLTLFYESVNKLRHDYDVAVIIVTHDLHGVSKYADRLILLNRSVITDGAPAEVLKNTAMLKTFGPIFQLPHPPPL